MALLPSAENLGALLNSTGAHGRIAFLTNPGTLVNIAQALLNTVNTTAQKRFFTDDQYDEAVGWSLED